MAKVSFSPRRENRHAAMQFIYMQDINKTEDLETALTLFFRQKDKPREFYAFAEELIKGTLEHVDTIDETIRTYAKNWDFSRIAKVDLAILRLAIYELLYCFHIPPIVSINEAIDLSKLFSTADSKRFINGILDAFKLKLHRPLRDASKQ
ncbi:MAG: transcription antitermination factor NusB [Verrucomicrobia bacterium GWC2_42_7]|nr:MAG: transcription antitermination factor NusB [Verrucomicrobia bacterium GWC2_42_7]